MIDLKKLFLTLGITLILLEDLDPSIKAIQFLKEHSYLKYLYIYFYTLNEFDDFKISLFSILFCFVIINRKKFFIKNEFNIFIFGKK